MCAGEAIGAQDGTGPLFPSGGLSKVKLFSFNASKPVINPLGGVEGLILASRPEGKWGTVCSSGFRGRAAMAVCRELVGTLFLFSELQSRPHERAQETGSS